MNYLVKSAIAALALVATAASTSAADANKAKGDSWVKLGTLTCLFDSSVGWVVGSVKEADCVYRGINKKHVRYTAELSRLGVDVGYTGAQTVVWAVLAPGTSDIDSLEGNYIGASADATVVVGLTANALLGGFKKSIALQPLSVGTQTGLNVAAGIGSLRIESAE